jgi:hypothetical protein
MGGSLARGQREAQDVRVLIAALLAASCGKGAGSSPKDASVAAPDAAIIVAKADDSGWAPLADMPRAHPRWTAHVPLADANAAAIDVHGPLIVDGSAVVSGSQLGAVGVDVATGAVRFQRPDTGRVAPPVVLGDDLFVVGDCADAVAAPAGKIVVGCYSVLDAANQSDHGAGSIVADGADAKALGAGPTMLRLHDRTAYLGRDSGWITWTIADPPRGEASATAVPQKEVPAPPEWSALLLDPGTRDAVDLAVHDSVLVIHYANPDLVADRQAVRDFANGDGALAVIAPRQVRGFQKVYGEDMIQPVVVHVDGLELDTLGAPLPGISILGAAQGDRGFVVAVRLDATLQHDYVAAVTADGALAWVYPLPPPPGQGRTAPVGVALTDGAAVVFFDGQILAALPPP